MERVKPYGILIGFVPLFIVILLLARFGKQGAIHCAPNPSVRRKKIRLHALSAVLVVLAMLISILGIARDGPLAMLFIFPLSAIVPFFFIPRLRPVYYREGWFRVKGCHPDFLATLPPVERYS